MKLKQILLSFCLVLSSATFLMGQTIQIKGSVQDAESESAIPDVQIFILDLAEDLLTDENGQFEVSLEPKSNNLLITFIKEGFVVASQQLLITDDKVERLKGRAKLLQ